MKAMLDPMIVDARIHLPVLFLEAEILSPHEKSGHGMPARCKIRLLDIAGE
jgi:hypothetical protein